MKTRFFFAWVLLAISVLACGRAGTMAKTYREMLDERPKPRITNLAERARPERAGKDAREAFYDLLKLRELGVPEAAPALIEVLRAHQGSNRIHGFAAAQALFTSGTVEAHHALRDHLLDPAYPVQLAFNYTWPWAMREPQRSQFIQRYLLQNLSEELELEVEPFWPDGENGRRLIVTVRLSNRGKRPLALKDWQVFKAEHLYFIAPDGQVLPRSKLVVYKPPMPRFMLIYPGEAHEYDLQVERRGAEVHQGLLRDPEAKVMLAALDIGFPVRIPGEYRVIAMLNQQPLDLANLNERQREAMDAEHWWAGRAVSKPALITIKWCTMHRGDPQSH